MTTGVPFLPQDRPHNAEHVPVHGLHHFEIHSVRIILRSAILGLPFPTRNGIVKVILNPQQLGQRLDRVQINQRHQQVLRNTLFPDSRQVPISTVALDL